MARTNNESSGGNAPKNAAPGGGPTDGLNHNSMSNDGPQQPQPVSMSIPAMAIDNEDISLPLSLIKGLRSRSNHHHHSHRRHASPAARADSSTSSTSDKDDSGGESNTSTTSKNGGPGTSLSIGTFGPMSSLSGSEEGGGSGASANGGGGRHAASGGSNCNSNNNNSNGNNSRAGILRNNINSITKDSRSADFMSTSSASSSSENIAGDELSERVVVRGKSVTSTSGSSNLVNQVTANNSGSGSGNGSSSSGALLSPQNQGGPPCKVSFAENHHHRHHNSSSSKRRRNENGANQEAVEESSSNKHHLEGSSSSSNNKRQRIPSNSSSQQEQSLKLKSNTVSSSSESNFCSDSHDVTMGDASANDTSSMAQHQRLPYQQHQQHSVAAVSFTSSNNTTESGSGSGGGRGEMQTSGQESSSNAFTTSFQMPADSTRSSSSSQDPSQIISSLSGADEAIGGSSGGGGGGQQQYTIGSTKPDVKTTKSSNPAMTTSSSTLQSPSSPNKLQDNLSNEDRRLERNQREKERSNKIASQVDALRSLLQRGGLFIPKNTKSTVLSEASNYIRTLQDRQQMMSMEMDQLKRQLVTAVAARQQIQQQQQGGMGPQVAGVPPGVAVPMVPPQVPPSQQGTASALTSPSVKNANADSSSSKFSSMEQDYHLIFKNTMAGMAVASMGGKLIDCNSAFHTETGLSSLELEDMTIFNIVHPSDLSRALEVISKMIDCGYVANREGDDGNNVESNMASNINSRGSTASQGSDSSQDEPVYLRSSFRHRPDLGLCVTLVRGDDCLAKCFNITLVKNASPPSPIPGALLSSDGNDITIPFNPTLPSLPSMAPPSSPEASPSLKGKSGGGDAGAAGAPPKALHMADASKPHQQQPQQVATNNFPAQPLQAAPVFNNTMAPGNGLLGGTMTTTNNNSAPVPTTAASPMAAPPPSMLAQAGANNMIPSGAIPPQLMQLILLSQQQQLQQHAQQQQLPMVANAPQGFYPIAAQQQPQQIQIPNQLGAFPQGLDPSTLLSMSAVGYPTNQATGMVNPMSAVASLQHPNTKPGVSLPSSSTSPSAGVGGAGNSSMINQQQQHQQAGGPAYYASG